MIRKWQSENTAPLLSLWLESTTEAHPFIDASYWQANEAVVRDEYLPAAETWVWEENGTLCGFISVMQFQFVGALFIAGVIPGVIMALLMMLLVFAVAKRRNYPREKFLSGREFLHACKEGFLPCLTPVIILLGIYTGLFTPTESAAIAVVYAAFLGLFVYKEITVRELGEVIKQTISDSVGLCALVATSNLFGTSLVKARIPQIIMSSVMGDIDNEIVFMLIVVGILLLVGMFMETVSAIAILTPIIVPIATSLGVSLVHLGVVVVLTLMIGVLSPPFGVVLFAVNRVGEIPMGRLIRALIPWFVILLVGLLIVALVPQTCTWLPALANLGV